MPTLPTSCTSACPSMEAAADQLATAITAAASQTSEQAWRAHGLWEGEESSSTVQQ